MATIAANLQAVKGQIRSAAQAAGRDPHEVTLVAVSKTCPASAVREAAGAGQRSFGENYAQEGAAKAAELGELGLIWHFIGPVQSNKTALIAAHFDWVHSVERLKIAERLSSARAGMAPLNVCIQVNTSRERGKSGVAPEELPALARAVEKLPNLLLRGLMAIPEPAMNLEIQRRSFARLRELKDHLLEQGIALDTLSMGMTQDLEAALLEGATLVRIGTAIFGERPKK
jgi:pyridoxal phosphate enzyme (YggS family)